VIGEVRIFTWLDFCLAGQCIGEWQVIRLSPQTPPSVLKLERAEILQEIFEILSGAEMWEVI